MSILETKIKEELVGFRGRIGLAIEAGDEGIYFNSDEVFPSASVIKVPILLAGLRQAEEGLVNLDKLTVITERVGGSGVLQSLSSLASLTIKDLLTLMITVSDNVATNMVIDLLGIESINQEIERLGLKSTNLKRKMMDFAAIQRGFDNVTCPSDMVKCLKAINEGAFLSGESKKVALTIMHAQQFLDKLPAMMDSERVFIANKTGGLPNVEHDCAIFKYKGETAYAAVLTDQLEDSYRAKQMISRIGKHIYDYLLS
ncbi:serine hydrolase [Neobacillus niacini]|uniref:serine hydrolase n=1 Tax=Neobacillus niacini TaxID=86668 RepID=UPI0021CAF216|nr:serine hydrolase [Neobacillus niacini]MCM3764268.1 class A beta-lactamase-related serine hydrolase [Neobacillus niacini]